MGVTPEGVELPRCAVDTEMKSHVQQMPDPVRPHLPSGPDLKWRYMWRVGPRPVRTRFQVRICADLHLRGQSAVRMRGVAVTDVDFETVEVILGCITCRNSTQSL